MRIFKIALIILALLTLSASASASIMLSQLGSTLSGFPTMAENNGLVPINNNIFSGFTETQPGSGSILVSPMTFKSPFSSITGGTSMFSGFTGLKSSSPGSLFSSGIANNIAVNQPENGLSLASDSTPMTMKTTDLYTATSPAEEYAYVDSLHGSEITIASHPTGKVLKALEIISTTDLYKEYTKYPHTPWRYLDLSDGAGYQAGTVDITTEICPKYPSGPSTVNEWYDPNAPASGELFFCVDLNTGKILSQSFGDYRDAL